MSLPDLDKLSKDRRDWLEVFGNQWGVKHPEVEPLTAEEKQGLLDALNPWAKRPEERGWLIPVEGLTLEQFMKRYPESQNGPNFPVRCLISK